ncbi:uncharacterized protein EAF02_003650 [Botrytis sinoallii]|uniref:uncharacterized protein n=1 Tax=Botrytis sinoallii TaxID=1463999 RepID=UPI001901EB86|nr:uncharacterized protein EAF02_003650 [Botrytis sinoallii]KAF7887003.1 hypothetical protein EAF02_003650 [Botrytis sinoallii]
MPRLPTKNDQINLLRMQLEAEQRSCASLRHTIKAKQATIESTLAQLKDAKESLIQAKSTSPFMRKLPIELRLKIYKLLLVNPKLSETESIGKAVEYGKSVKFELTPAILSTCKAIHSEAEPILYGSNTFIIECIGGYGPVGSLHVPQSPLTRFTDPSFDDFDDNPFDFSAFSALKKVKRWRILTGAYRPTPTNPVPAKSFVHFCQALCQEAPTQPQRSLEIVLALARVNTGIATIKTEDTQYKFSQDQLKYLLQPLRLLRDIKLELNIAQFKTDLPQSTHLCGAGPEYYFPYSEAQTVEVNLERSMNLALPIVQKYQAIAEDLSPVEKVFKMYERLERYVVSFERSGKFTMDLITLQRGHEGSRRETRHFGWQLPGASLGNPFKSRSPLSYHPVELAFSKAIIAKDKEDVTEFKAARASILKELDPQYRRMVDASKKLTAFVEKERLSGVFHECTGCGVFHQYEEDPYESTLGEDLDRYIYELDKIASLLNRTMPDHIQIQVQKGTTIKLRWMQKQDIVVKSPLQIAKWTKRLIEDMWEHCQRISWHRECLFKDDITDIGCKINKKLGQGLMEQELEWLEGFESDDEEFHELHYGD